MNKKIKTNDQWETKYIRETPFMSFGSLMNAFGQANQQKGITAEELKKVAKELFSLSLELTEEAFNRVEKSEEEQGFNF